MPQYIIKLPCDGEDYYLLWSSIVDAPVTHGVPLAEFNAHYMLTHGTGGMKELPDRMKRVAATGTSDALDRRSVMEYIAFNRAGDNEACLMPDEIIDKYIRQPNKARHNE